MDIKDYIGTDVIIEKTKTSCVLTEITAPYIQVQTKAPNSSGYPSAYRFELLKDDNWIRIDCESEVWCDYDMEKLPMKLYRKA
jgi:hypothetical protein